MNSRFDANSRGVHQTIVGASTCGALLHRAPTTTHKPVGPLPAFEPGSSLLDGLILREDVGHSEFLSGVSSSTKKLLTYLLVLSKPWASGVFEQWCWTYLRVVTAHSPADNTCDFRPLLRSSLGMLVEQRFSNLPTSPTTLPESARAVITRFRSRTT